MQSTVTCNTNITVYGKTDGARCSSVVRAFAHGAMGRRIDPLWGGPIESGAMPTSPAASSVTAIAIENDITRITQWLIRQNRHSQIAKISSREVSD